MAVLSPLQLSVGMPNVYEGADNKDRQLLLFDKPSQNIGGSVTIKHVLHVQATRHCLPQLKHCDLHTPLVVLNTGQTLFASLPLNSEQYLDQTYSHDPTNNNTLMRTTRSNAHGANCTA